MRGTVEEPLCLPQPYEELSHTADIALRVVGETEKETLCRLVLALGALLSGGGPITPEQTLRIEVEPAEPAVMAIDVLRELLYRFTVEGAIPVRCGVARFDEERGAELELALGSYDEELHQAGTDVKAVTFHQARFERAPGGGWVAEAVLDI